MFRFFPFQRCGDVFFDILITSKGPSALGMFRNLIIIKFPYNAHSDWLKQRALSENKARVDEGKLAFEFVIRNFDKFDPN